MIWASPLRRVVYLLPIWPVIAALTAGGLLELRKVAPLRELLGGYEAWISGIRRDQSPARANAEVVEWDESFGLVKINPLVAWTRDEVQAYIRLQGLPVNPLLSQGFGSVGCWPCTHPSADERGGRWVGRAKTECGIHLCPKETT